MKTLYLLFLFPMLLWGDHFTTELRIGNFYPTSDLLRKIYGKKGVEFEVEGCVQLHNKLSFWMNFNSFCKHGHSLGLEDKTTLHIYPLSTGLKYTFCFNECLAFYLGVGGSYSWINIHDRSSLVKEHIHKYGWGGVGKSGLIYFFTDRCFLDLFADYYSTKVCGEDHSVNVGGLRLGLGAGISY